MRTSAGILVFRNPPDGTPEVLLGHMGGPYWARRDEGAWTIPKGEHPSTEDPLEAARREFVEELGLPVPPGRLLDLGEVRQSAAKRLRCWAVEGDVDVDAVVSGTFEMEWPPRSGRTTAFPELDRVAWFELGAARVKLVRGQVPLIDRLAAELGLSPAR